MPANLLRRMNLRMLYYNRWRNTLPCGLSAAGSEVEERPFDGAGGRRATVPTGGCRAASSAEVRRPVRRSADDRESAP